MLLACDPSLLLCSGEEVRRCKAMIDDYDTHLKDLPEGVSETEMSRTLWEAQVSKLATCNKLGNKVVIIFSMAINHFIF